MALPDRGAATYLNLGAAISAIIYFHHVYSGRVFPDRCKSKGLTVFARIDHAAGAEDVDMKLQPTEVLIFDNAKGGTPLMQADQRIGIDLPLKALVYEDEVGKVWLCYNDPSWLAQRYGLGAAVATNVEALSNALTTFAERAAKSI